MEYQEMKQLAIDYTNESAYWDTKEEYISSLKLNEKDNKSLKFYIKVELHKQSRLIKEAELQKVLSSCTSFKAVNQTNKERIIIFHPCTYPDYKFQLSYFDSLGAIMDEKSNTIEETIDNYCRNSQNYKIVELIA